MRQLDGTEHEGVTMELWQVVAREGIRDLVTRYNSNGDSGRFEQVMELFTDDAVMELQDRVCRGKDEIITIFTGTKERLRGGSTPGYVRHFTATHQIDLTDESNATGRAYYSVISPTGLDHWGRYLDTYRVVDGRWRFAHRKVTVDGQASTSVIAG
jgi:ketosteroid isomerase-like protein